MSLYEWLLKHPLLRPLLAVAVGIVVGDSLFFHHIFPPYYIWIGAVAICIVGTCLAYAFGKHRPHGVGLLIMATFMSIGMVRAHLKLTQTCTSWDTSPSIYRAKVTDTPIEKPKTYLCRAAIDDQSVLLYLHKDSLSATVRRGDELSFRAQLSFPKDTLTNKHFNYAHYLRRQGVSGTAYVPRGRWMPEEGTSNHSWKETALNSRDRILEIYRRLPFNTDQIAVLSALTVGYKNDLSNDLRQTFATSGAGHILALSGLHVGLIYGLLWLLFGGNKLKSTPVKAVQTLLTLLLLWGFAFMTGLSASVVRATLMFSAIAISRFAPGQPVSFNTLCATAMFMLLYRPAWLFDVGFQLSFAAVTAIIWIQPWLAGLLTLRHRAARYTWDLITVSVAAQAGVAPLLAYYFGNFATYFLLTNLIVIPLASGILYCAVLMLALTPVTGLQDLSAQVVRLLLDALQGFTQFVEQLPYASVTVHPTQVDVWMYYLSLTTVGVYIATRKANVLLTFLCLILLYLIYKYRIFA